MCAPICGDGMVIGTEQCDDGDTAAGDGCSPTCTVEPGFSCMGDPSNCVEVCGDGLVVGGEGCDDGNVGAGDGCAATCTVETGWTCAGEPSLCAPICGDGLVVGTEGCDEGGLNGSAAGCCAATCEPKAVGSSCDDGEICTANDTCNGANVCVGGAAPSCDDGDICTADSCLVGTGCQHDTAPRDGFACDDGNACSSGDVCAAGVCAGTTGADTDGDGYCDADENARGCDPNDAAEIPPQPPVFGGIPVNGAANFLVTWVVPTSRGVVKASDPSCASVGVCGAGGFCTAGKIADPCTVAADCNQAANTCRVVVNYADVPGLTARRPFLINRTPVPALRAADRRLHAEGRRGARSGAPHERPQGQGERDRRRPHAPRLRHLHVSLEHEERRKPMRFAHRIASLSLVLLIAAVTTASADELAINVLSNRADLVSGDDALIEVIVPADVTTADVHVTRNGVDVTSSFGLTTTGRFLGLVDGLDPGDNDIEAFVTAPTLHPSVAITINNHAIGGPVFAGAQLQPWVCAHKVATSVLVTIPNSSPVLSANVTSRASGLADEPVDAQCNTPPTLAFFYQPKALEGSRLQLHQHGCERVLHRVRHQQPARRRRHRQLHERPRRHGEEHHLAREGHDQSHDLPARDLLRSDQAEHAAGAADRVEPEAPVELRRVVGHEPLRESPGHGRLQHDGALARVHDRVGVAHRPRDQRQRSARRRDHGDAEGADHRDLRRDPLHHGRGLLGRIDPAIQHRRGVSWAAERHPAELHVPGHVDDRDRGRRVRDAAGELLHHRARQYAHDRASAAPSTATTRPITAPPGTRRSCRRAIPTTPANCGSGWPAALTYSPVSRPQGIRCEVFDHDVGMLGTFVDTDGNTKANNPFDNVGVQYGLKPLQTGVINAEQFVQLNEGAGSYTADQVFRKPQRAVASLSTLHTVYTGSLVSDGHQLAKTAIIDLRGNNLTADIHLNWRSWQVRDRLDRANGNHGNQVIWATGAQQNTPGAAMLLRSFNTMDTWLANIEADHSNTPLPQKIVNDKPPLAVDLCTAGSGATEASIVDVGARHARVPGAVHAVAAPGRRRPAGGRRLQVSIEAARLREPRLQRRRVQRGAAGATRGGLSGRRV